jgi:hypothetical protein
MWHPSKVMRHKSQRLGKTEIEGRQKEMDQSRELPHRGKWAIFKSGKDSLI